MADFSWAPPELRKLIRYEDGKLVLGCQAEGCAEVRQTAGKGALLKKIEQGKVSSLLNCRMHGGLAGKFSPTQKAAWPTGHKACATCSEVLPLAAFQLHNVGLMGRTVQCRACRSARSKRDWAKVSFERAILNRTRPRARKYGIPHDIVLADILIPEICPILNVPIVKERNHPYGPSIDQIEPRKGYTKGNIQIISARANILKHNMTREEAALLHQWFQRKEPTP